MILIFLIAIAAIDYFAILGSFDFHGYVSDLNRTFCSSFFILSILLIQNGWDRPGWLIRTGELIRGGEEEMSAWIHHVVWPSNKFI